MAVIEASTGLHKTYSELNADVERAVVALPQRPTKCLALLLAQNRYACIVAYLAALRTGTALMVTDASLHRELLDGILKTYQPDLIFAACSQVAIPRYEKLAPTSFEVWARQEPCAPVQIHPQLALLLNTSGSTGSPKFVRLTLGNLHANAASIAEYLGLTSDEKPITSLPMAYSFGLSVINSHLLVGACLVLTEHGVLRREFWDSVDRYACTSFSGVPHTYQMLLQTGLLKKRGATLRTWTQAGGRLAESYVREMYELALERGGRFFVMYGQTEATARIAYVPFERLAFKPDSIGIAIPRGALRIDPTGELIYEGPSVMMGYADRREDLRKGDELGGVLATGDSARQDQDGFFQITGRRKRFLKLFGKRLNLDEVEQLIHQRTQVSAACYGHDDLLMVALEGHKNPETVETLLRQTLNLPSEAVQVFSVAALPRTLSGKIDYPTLTTMSAAQPSPIRQVAR